MIYSVEDVKRILSDIHKVEANLRYVGESAEAGSAHRIPEAYQEGLVSAADQLLKALTEIEAKL